MFIPVNEQGVVYLFSRYREKLGFEEIFHIGTRFPDVIAVRNGKHVSIELEYKLSGLLYHYIIKDVNNRHTQKWIKESEDKDRIYWRLLHQNSQNNNEWIKTADSVGFSKNIVKNIEEQDGMIIWKSLKPLCDIVICWEIDCELDDPDIEIIELKSVLEITE